MQESRFLVVEGLDTDLGRNFIAIMYIISF